MDLLSELNERQKQVVLHEQGPLLVMAGAGTGKTKTITNRILHLLHEKGAPASSILALTFTEKATHEMQDRVEANLPLSHEEIAIKTFHSFCDQVLRESGHEIGLSPSYKLLDQTNQWLFMKKHLFDFNLEYYRPLGNPAKFIWSLLQHFQKLKDENISPEQYLAWAETMEGEEEEIAKNVELAKAFSRYQELLIDDGAMDFADLTFYALKLFEQRPSVLKYYQRKFKYILVDEFQDTNFAQSQLVFALAKMHQNIVVVGDDDQSIYKWRGASLSNIIHFETEYPKSSRVVLNKNYRSSQKILDASYHLIQNNNPDRLEVREKVNKKLESQRGEGENIRIIHFENVNEEVEFCLQQIQQIKNENLAYSDFAVLLRTNALAEYYVNAFKSAAIPYQIKSPRGFFRTEMVRDVIALFRALGDRDDDIALFRLLSMPVLGVPTELVQDYLAMAKKQSMSLYDVLQDHLDKDESLPGLEGASIKLFKIIADLKKNIYKKPIGQTLYDFFQGIELMEFLQSEDSSENIRDIEHLSKFSRIVAEFDSEHHDVNPQAFLEYLQLLEEADASFAMDEPEIRDAVQILTIHGSKGLEFKNVFVASLVNQRFPSTNRRDPFEMPLDLINEVLPEKNHHIEEERRLMYVAMTRAKEKLFLTYSDYYGGKKKWKESRFLAEIKGLPGVDFLEYPELESRDLEDRELKKLGEDLNLERPHRSIKRFSYSQFDTFKTCPLKYQFRYLYKLAPPPSHASQFGSSVHNTLNDFYQKLRDGKEPSFELMEELYEKHWLPYGYTSKAHQLARKKKGLEMLKVFYESNSKPEWIIPTYLEKAFSLKVGNSVINGRIDRVDRLEDATYEIIDYKTGKSRMGAKLEKDLQLGIYAIVGQEIYNLKVGKLTLYFLDDNVKQSINYEDLDLEYVKEKIESYCEDIPNSDFAATPGFPCGFCDYRLVCKASASKVA